MFSNSFLFRQQKKTDVMELVPKTLIDKTGSVMILLKKGVRKVFTMSFCLVKEWKKAKWQSSPGRDLASKNGDLSFTLHLFVWLLPILCAFSFLRYL